jgi:ribosomal protein L11 methylase PrmA
MTAPGGIEPGSFRDPSGFLFWQDGVLYRQVNLSYREHFDLLKTSGLYQQLTAGDQLITHEECDPGLARTADAYKVIRPVLVPFISYPYEWCFSQLKDAALTTLSIQKRALQRGLSLKDSSAYNIQFLGSRPVLIDSLSFEAYREGEPWTAYRQFCQHFLAPLALMSLVDIRLGQLLRVYIDGIPLDLASGLLPGKTKLNPGLAAHIHLHAASQARYADKTVDKTAVTRKMNKTSFLGLIDNLEATTAGLTIKRAGSEWGEYYDITNYSPAAAEHKAETVRHFLDRVRPASVWDLGANNGVFSREASRRAIPTVAFDIDPDAVEQNYLQCRAEKDAYLLPLLVDLTNPSPSLGWSHRERMSFMERGTPDVTLALALIHHLAIANNVPLVDLARFFAALGPWLVLEFVPKSDSQVQRLLATRQDIFPDYTPEGFEQAFSSVYRIEARTQLRESERTMYLLESKATAA